MPGGTGSNFKTWKCLEIPQTKTMERLFLKQHFGINYRDNLYLGYIFEGRIQREDSTLDLSYTYSAN